MEHVDKEVREKAETKSGKNNAFRAVRLPLWQTLLASFLATCFAVCIIITIEKHDLERKYRVYGSGESS